MVSPTILKSWRLAPSTARPMGRPLPSVSRLRFVPPLARSVGLGPVFFPAEWSLAHRPIHRLPFPIDALQLVEGKKAGFPKGQEDSSAGPLAKATISRGTGADSSAVQRIPLATRSKHE